MKKVLWTFDSAAENKKKVQWTFYNTAENKPTSPVPANVTMLFL